MKEIQEENLTVNLDTKDKLNIYINPVRQQLLHELAVAESPLSPKALSLKLNISASSVQHHIKKLLTLGVIAADHTESINGITATFYKPLPVRVQIGIAQSFTNEKLALLMQLVSNVMAGFTRVLERHQNKKLPGDLSNYGDVLTGIAYIAEQEREELFGIVNDYIQKHEIPKENADAWEYAVVLYNTTEKGLTQ